VPSERELMLSEQLAQPHPEELPLLGSG
jgi:hypothetical protein